MKTYRTVLMFAYSALLAGKLLAPTPTNAATPDNDKQFLSMAAQSDINEITLSELAETKAASPQVKAFARTTTSQKCR
jgi:putative membrane protein